MVNVLRHFKHANSYYLRTWNAISYAWNSLKFLRKTTGMYKRNYWFRPKIMEEIFASRSCKQSTNFDEWYQNLHIWSVHSTVNKELHAWCHNATQTMKICLHIITAIVRTSIAFTACPGTRHGSFLPDIQAISHSHSLSLSFSLSQFKKQCISVATNQRVKFCNSRYNCFLHENGIHLKKLVFLGAAPYLLIIGCWFIRHGSCICHTEGRLLQV